MTHTISVIQQKGGCGKSTLTVSLASILAGEGHKVIIPDTDALRSSSLWAEQEVPSRGEIDHVHETNDNEIISLLRELQGQYDYTLVDTAGFNTRIAAYVAAASDLVLIPCTTTIADIQGAVNTQRFLSKLSAKIGKAINSAVVRTNFKRGQINDDAISAKLNEEADLDILDSVLWHSTTFETALNTGEQLRGLAKAHSQELVRELRSKHLIPPAITHKEAA
ncbi:ParA family protein [Pseudovibrio ascidiaceicola]|uniref:ParA family protein n=1 Tax=Pseudovibrio ascidiaceicola TaxID=285279 RepID=UPI003D362B67